MALIDRISRKLDEFQQSKIEAIDRFDYSNVKWKVSKDLSGVTDKYIDEGIENLKLYYAVALLDPLNGHAVSRAVDPFWHAHVLFTKDYGRFCDEIFGGYVHHEPLDEANAAEMKKVERLYRYTIGIYADLFKDVDESWWGKSFGPFKLVCLHMLVKDPEIMRHALFPSNPEMQTD